MEFDNLSKFGTAEKIILAEQLWDSISKNELKISNDLNKELGNRLVNLKNGKTNFCILGMK